MLALVSAKRISELHGLLFLFCHSRGWRSCTFSYLPRFDEFTIPSLDNFVGGGGDRDELLFYPIRDLQKYLARIEQYHLYIYNHFICTSQQEK